MVTDTTYYGYKSRSAARRSRTFRTRRARTRSSNVRNGALSPFTAAQAETCFQDETEKLKQSLEVLSGALNQPWGRRSQHSWVA